MPNTNVITIESNIPIPSYGVRGSAIKYNFIDSMQVSDSFYINGNTPDFSTVSVRSHVYGLNSTTDRNYTIRTITGSSANPNSIRVWRTA